MTGPPTYLESEEQQNSDTEQSNEFSKYSYPPSDNSGRKHDLPDSFNNGMSYVDLMSMKCFTGEKHLVNGDFYCGSWQGHLPDGSGKYLWADGCMYEGEWQKGKKTGKGKLSWPSGATYEGDFMGGYIHGLGTFTGVDGTTYKGNWSMNRKHGLGKMRYANGDIYEGSWKVGAQDGPGRYVWIRGTEYMGEWKDGVMCGKGFLTWANGDVFDGEWLDGAEHGYGIYYWQDGSFYVGTWNRGLKDGKGVFYPFGSFPFRVQTSVNGTFRDKKRREELIEELIAAGILDIRSKACLFDNEWAAGRPPRKSRRASSSEKISLITVHSLEHPMTKNVRLERKWSLEGSLEKLIGLGARSASKKAGELILQSKVSSFGQLGFPTSPIVKREYVQGVLISEIVKPTTPVILSKHSKKWLKRQEREAKRPGETIFKGHRSYDLMLSLQLGIRYTVGKMTSEPKHDICPLDYGSRASVHMRFPRFGSKLTPCHQTVDFTWKDYCPKVFRHLRETFKIDSADYMLSLCGNDALRELSSPGKSGSVFFLSNDDRFMIKTLRKSEVQVLLNMLPNYHDHVHAYENTLITKFFGLHRVRPRGGHKVRFVVMGNMFCTDLHIHRRYDLKGSKQGRTTDTAEINENTTLKDMDLDFVFHLQPSWRVSLLKQIECDCKFLESERIMDYSLLLGLHFRAPVFPPALLPKQHTAINADGEVEEDWAQMGGLVLVPREAGLKVNAPGLHIRGGPLKWPAADDDEVDLLLPGTARLQIQLGMNMPARADRTRPGKTDGNGEVFNEVYDVVLYLGIIDILQEYDISKQIEHAYKSIQFDHVSISVVDPNFYSRRFQKFISQVFPEDMIS
ncbi:hypothetical protein O6H91_14G007000 [Diphasiastrum complanatum]|uniref:Uncharacterized protein n=1 Tax=Diphasiastrum complanatum TaxID=34168 RepID=A0ACC2BL86_DIPCM|nr:hypothetical protein O6H91_14G007000 [Diphasiastrum complanatum]